jgi:hypothetical protein
MLWNTEATCNFSFFIPLLSSLFLLATAIKFILLLEMNAGSRIKSWHHNLCVVGVEKSWNSFSRSPDFERTEREL